MDNVAISSDNDATAEERGAGQGVGDAPQTFDIDASRSQPYDLQAYLFGKQCSSEVERTKKKKRREGKCREVMLVMQPQAAVQSW